MATLQNRSHRKHIRILGLVFSISIFLSAQPIKPANALSTLILKDFDPNELNGDGWAFQPRVQISAPSKFILQNEPVSIDMLPQKLLEYALLCPSHKRYILLKIDKDVPPSTLILFLLALKRANQLRKNSSDPDSAIPITAIIPVDRATQQPTFPIPLTKPTIKSHPPSTP